MPVDMKRYPKNWHEIAKAVKDKANWKCEFCGIAHGTLQIGVKGRAYNVILTVAHVGDNKHDKMDTTNLKALCQPCHLRLDIKEHVANAKETRRKKKLAVQPILAGLEE